MTDKTKLVAISRTDDMSALDALKLLRFRRYNTARSQLRVTSVWSAWCARHGLTPFPVTAVDVERYINGLNGSVKMATISHFIACLSSVNSSLGFPDFRNVLIKALVQVWRARENEKKIATGQALPFLISDLNILRRSLHKSDDLRDIRDLAMIWVGFETLLRNVEIRRIKTGDLKWQNDTSCYLLDVMRTKTSLSSNLTFQLSPQCSQHVRRLIETVEYTDTETFGHRFLFQPVNIHTNRYFPSTSSKLSRGKSIDRMLVKAGFSEGLLTQLQNESKVSREDVGMLSSNSLNQAFARLWGIAGKVGDSNRQSGRYRTWTGHSVRVGGAIELFKAGYSLEKITEMGNWSDPKMVFRYIRGYLASEKAMVSFMRNHLDDI
ncbi:tyrosine-type recombinase/integrase [Klebsiella quasipneumoniae]|uniref:tyrosine-type recombinase/integrase n=1 Tax=Klebsiella quasipneumoniae TaxID=1463165 RepID=UPI0023E23D4F|nr:tyrosine-type recombinase/integrase [Klebsiella quasipneumoniae]